MNKTEISKGGRYSSDFYGIVFGLGSLAGFLIINWTDSSLFVIIPSFILIFIAFWFYGRYKTVSFDNTKIYFKKSGQMTEVALSSIKEVRLDKWMLVDNNKAPFSISYIDLKGQQNKVKFIPNKHAPDFDRFLATLIDVNNEVLIINTE